MTPAERTLFVCVRDRHGKGASCAGSGSRALLKEMRAMLQREGIAEEELLPRACGCLGLCKQGPVMVAGVGRKPPKVKKKGKGVFTRVAADEARDVLRAVLVGKT